MLINLIIAVVSILGTILIEELRHRRDSGLQLMAQDVAKKLLENDDRNKRSFDAIKNRLGGFDDNELRRILVSVGAVRFKAVDGKELWGLIERNEDDL